MKENTFFIRSAKPEEFERVGNLLVSVYSELEGFPDIVEQPEYYNFLKTVGL